MDEQEIIARYFGSHARQRKDVVLGIGDDAAITSLAPGHDLVTATDCLVEGTHFLPGCPARSVGHRALAVNLSDLAAMGAEPLWFTLALSLPSADERWLEQFSSGLLDLANGFRIALIGGDTVRGPLSASVTVLGQVPGGGGVRRGAASAGDGVWVTGTPGDAVAGRLAPEDLSGLPVENSPEEASTPAGRKAAVEYLRARFLYPAPRVQAGLALAGLASSMIDVSDGLHVDIQRLLGPRGAVLDAGALPLSPALRACRAGDAIRYALTGGDDYELCFTVPAGREPEVVGLRERLDVPLTRIGHVTDSSGVGWLLDGQNLEVPDAGFRHF